MKRLQVVIAAQRNGRVKGHASFHGGGVAMVLRSRALGRGGPERIGNLVVTGDRDTVFGVLDQESETLPATYRSHGSRYETAVPLIIHDETRKLEETA